MLRAFRARRLLEQGGGAGGAQPYHGASRSASAARTLVGRHARLDCSLPSAVARLRNAASLYWLLRTSLLSPMQHYD